MVLATSRQPDNRLEAALEGQVQQLFCIGDALAPRMWAAATFEGHKFARWIGEPGAPGTMGEAFFREDEPPDIPVAADVSRL